MKKFFLSIAILLLLCITAFGATVGETNALRAAKDYWEVSAFSYSGLIKILEFAEFSHSEAVYAADNCEADWNEQAAKAAKNYLEVMAFSRSGLLKTLERVGFTHEQAEYGVKQVGY